MSSACSLGDARDMAMLADFLSASEDSAPLPLDSWIDGVPAGPSQQPASHAGHLPAWAGGAGGAGGTGGAAAQSMLPRECVLDTLGLQPEPGMEDSCAELRMASA
ncbi:hypothetical protein WJX81_005611 [Elliptochloris bilobata]|uniref:Uncharacterized protein n=1 Tax=Elliptochloris bilobata TaxID=381761 RepID=A0AAW1RNN0_9CHLO